MDGPGRPSLYEPEFATQACATAVPSNGAKGRSYRINFGEFCFSPLPPAARCD